MEELQLEDLIVRAEEEAMSKKKMLEREWKKYVRKSNSEGQLLSSTPVTTSSLGVKVRGASPWWWPAEAKRARTRLSAYGKLEQTGRWREKELWWDGRRGRI
ncbi:hypothetical protein M378DRAFT_12834 [Amanita muscaria Koide BX008]|uniref:Uncharacterized protein n=1 Tax=Amanita muscaria (strain Koide BX008) TaxID=946122 RepID=A0A0C2WLT2_AMAMK|nr:hypothetical protein M378DRAFT_12834 [Amanita muscaria Koide BX008]